MEDDPTPDRAAATEGQSPQGAAAPEDAPSRKPDGESAGDKGPTGVSSAPDEKPSEATLRGLWTRAVKHPVWSVLIATALLGVLGPLVAPIPSVPGKVFDSARDFFRSFDGKYADGLKEYVQTSEVWSDKEHLTFDDAFTHARHDADLTLMQIPGGVGARVGWVSANDVYEEPSDYVSQPSFIVARVDRSRTLPDAEFNGSPIFLVEASGFDGLRVFAIPSGYLKAPTEVTDGDVVAFRGILAGVGTTNLGGNKLPAIMILASSASEVTLEATPDVDEAAYGPELEDLVSKLRLGATLDDSELDDVISKLRLGAALDDPPLDDVIRRLRKLPAVPPG